MRSTNATKLLRGGDIEYLLFRIVGGVRQVQLRNLRMINMARTMPAHPMEKVDHWLTRSTSFEVPIYLCCLVHQQVFFLNFYFFIKVRRLKTVTRMICKRVFDPMLPRVRKEPKKNCKRLNFRKSQVLSIKLASVSQKGRTLCNGANFHLAKLSKIL